MKLTEFRKLIREEVRKAMKEAPKNQTPVQKYVDTIIDIASSGQAGHTGLEDPDFIKELKTMVKELKAKNLLAQVSKEIVKLTKTNEWSEDSIITLTNLGFDMRGAEAYDDLY